MKRQLWAILVFSLLTLLLTACSHTHNFDERETTIEASCEEPGLKIQKCRCGNENRIQILPLGHQYEVYEDVESSCQGKGYITYVCTHCKISYTEPTEQRTYTATELNEMYRESVGELAVYDKKGNCISVGSCFVYSADGQLITNYHVIEGGYSAEATLAGRTYQISIVVSFDKEIDLALLKISANNSQPLQPVKVCRREHKTGETVYTLGNSQGLTSTFSKGIITYSDREYEGVHYVQHDAAISSGNSGGPLINEYGEVIGINTLTLEDSQNLNFAIRVSELSQLYNYFSMPMTEFYEKERNAYQKLSTHLLENGTYRQEFGTYMLILDYTQEGSHHFRIWAEYAPDKELIDFFIEVDAIFCTAIQFDKSCNGSYEWYCFDDYYELAGIINARTYTYNGPLSYEYTNTTSNQHSESLSKSASISITLICDCITSSFQEIGVDARDFGFSNF